MDQTPTLTRDGVRSSYRAKGRGLCGWLWKRGGRVQNWKKRWFVVVGDQLFYYRTPSDPRPTGYIPLPGNQVLRHPFDPRHPDKHMFEIVAGDRRLQVRNHESFMLSAESAEDLETWVSVVNRIIREPLGGGMFGRDVARTVKQEARQLGGGSVPLIVQKTVMFLRHKGLNELGLFRLPGNQLKVQALKESFDKGENPDLLSYEEVHSVASLLKLYLRELPEPLIPFEYFDMFISAACVLEKDETEGVQQVDKQLKLLPEENLKLLKYLCHFLFEFQTHSAKTKMDLVNLATVFGPNFIRPQSNDPQSIMENTSLMTILTKALIKHEQCLFQEVHNNVHLPNRLMRREDSDTGTQESPGLGIRPSDSDQHHHYEELPSRNYRMGTAPCCSLHRLKDGVEESLAIDSNSSSSDASPCVLRRQTITSTTEQRGSTGNDGNSAKIIGKKLHESSDSDGVEDTFPPYAVIRKPSKTFETQKLKLQELREEVAKLKKNQAETAEQVDELQARLDLEMKARLEGEKSLKHEQKKREAWESRYKQEVKFREDMERRCKELQEQLDQVYATFSST